MYVQPDPLMLDAWMKKGPCITRKAQLALLKKKRKKASRLALHKNRLALKKKQNGISQETTTGN